jgi:hypothetical protein
MRTREKPSGHAPATGVYACEAMLCAEASHAGSDRKYSQITVLVHAISDIKRTLIEKALEMVEM